MYCAVCKMRKIMHNASPHLYVLHLRLSKTGLTIPLGLCIPKCLIYSPLDTTE